VATHIKKKKKKKKTSFNPCRTKRVIGSQKGNKLFCTNMIILHNIFRPNTESEVVGRALELMDANIRTNNRSQRAPRVAQISAQWIVRILLD
jgi:hypothetical protein